MLAYRVHIPVISDSVGSESFRLIGKAILEQVCLQYRGNIIEFFPTLRELGMEIADL